MSSVSIGPGIAGRIELHEYRYTWILDIGKFLMRTETVPKSDKDNLFDGWPSLFVHVVEV